MPTLSEPFDLDAALAEPVVVALQNSCGEVAAHEYRLETWSVVDINVSFVITKGGAVNIDTEGCGAD